MYRFEKLTVWQKAMDFAQEVYEVSKGFPKDELYGLTSQLRRAATSIPLNIAEGSGCKTKKEFVQFLFVALRSEYEVATILKLVTRLGYVSAARVKLLGASLAEVGRLLQGLINSLHQGPSDN